MSAKQPEIEELRAALNAYQRDGRTGTMQSENVIDAAIAVVRVYDEQVARADRMRDEAVKAALQETADPGVYSAAVPKLCTCPGGRYPGDPQAVGPWCAIHGVTT